MAQSSRTWQYHWWDPVWGACFGGVATYIAGRAGYSYTVAVCVGVFVGLLGAGVTALAVWVDRRDSSGIPGGRPERTLEWFSTFLRTYARVNRRVWYALLLLIVVSLVWIGLTR